MSEEHDLVARARRGDSAATDALLTRYASLAYTTALRLVANSAEAQEIAQEALFRAYTQLETLRDDRQFGAWLRRMSVNLSITLMRRRGRLHFESLDRHVFDDSGRERAHRFRDERTPTPEERVIELLDNSEIQAVLARLPADQRVAVVLRDMYGYEIAEVAALARCGLSAAKMRVSRARTALRSLLGRPAERGEA